MLQSIVYQQHRAFELAAHRDKVSNRLECLKNAEAPNGTHFPKGFHRLTYTETRHFSFELGYGAAEAAHTDEDTWQALLVVEMNGWRLGGPQDEEPVPQEPGDLLILDQSVPHWVTPDPEAPPPTRAWRMILIDSLLRLGKWSKEELSQSQAIDLALAAVNELNDPIFLNWFTGGRYRCREH